MLSFSYILSPYLTDFSRCFLISLSHQLKATKTKNVEKLFIFLIIKVDIARSFYSNNFSKFPKDISNRSVESTFTFCLGCCDGLDFR